MASPTLRRCRSRRSACPVEGREHDVRVVRVVVDEECEVCLARGGRIERGQAPGDRQILFHRGECGLGITQYLLVVAALACPEGCVHVVDVAARGLAPTATMAPMESTSIGTPK